MTTFSRALIEVTIAAPVDEVWKSLRDRERIAQWFGWDSDSLPAEIDFIFFKRATGDEDAHTLTFGLGDRVEIEPRGAATVLRIVRPAPTADHDWDDIFEDMTQGWIAFSYRCGLLSNATRSTSAAPCSSPGHRRPRTRLSLRARSGCQLQARRAPVRDHRADGRRARGPGLASRPPPGRADRRRRGRRPADRDGPRAR